MLMVSAVSASFMRVCLPVRSWMGSGRRVNPASLATAAIPLEPAPALRHDRTRANAWEGIVMSPTAFGLVIIFLVAGCVLGWHAQRARSSHGDVRATRSRLPGFRRTRMRSGLWVLAVAVILLLVLSDMLRH